MLKIKALMVAAVFALSASPVIGSEHVITQQDEKFSELFLKIQHKDIVKFINQDTVNHKLTVSYKNHNQSFEALVPGKSQAIEFNKAGIYDINCAIHDNMKLTVFVPHIVQLSSK